MVVFSPKQSCIAFIVVYSCLLHCFVALETHAFLNSAVKFSEITIYALLKHNICFAKTLKGMEIFRIFWSVQCSETFFRPLRIYLILPQFFAENLIGVG